jgi:3-methyl-2-oxobutanoate hydroxymethyltransferase
MYLSETRRPQTIATLKAAKHQHKLTMVTAYDYTMAKLVDDSADIILVGDSLGCVVQGNDTTLGVTLEQMIYHASMVKRGAEKALVVADLPFGSYQRDPAQALDAGVQMLKESGVAAVKLEGGETVCDSISKLVQAGVPVMGHLGLTPQSYHALGGNRVQAKTPETAKRLVNDAMALQQAGAFAIVLEAIPRDVAAEVSRMLEIPTIGIGAGVDCDGQVLVINDLIGLNESQAPMKFNREYCAVREPIREALGRFREEVRSRQFPTEAETYAPLMVLDQVQSITP